jgi:thioredoxin-dependent peroxiredoxin
VSFDPPEENLAWAQQEGFQYELWTDEGRELGLYYGAADSPTDGSASRITKVMDENGVLVLEYLAVSASLNPAEVLEDMQVLFGP